MSIIMFKNMNPFKFLVILTASAAVMFIVLVIYVYDTVSSNLPSLEQLENPPQNLATKVLSADGTILDHFYVERRINLPYDSIPKDFINALIATEDRNFYKHWGVHLRRVINSFVKRIVMGKNEGASTITMQLARNLFLTQEQSMRRKIRETFIAIQIEKNYSKREILEMYANTVIFGRGAYGIQVAAKTYFNKSPGQLTTSECAYLVGTLKNPEKYNGLRNLSYAIGRRNTVLGLMLDEDYLTEEQYQKAIAEPLIIDKGAFYGARTTYIAPHFVEMVKDVIKTNTDEFASVSGYDLYRDGLTIYTTLNSRIQRYIEKAASEHFGKYQKIFSKSFSWNKNKSILESHLMRAIEDNPLYIAAVARSQKREIERTLRRNKEFVDSVKNAVTTVQTGIVILDPNTGAILGMVGASPKFMRENPAAKYSLNHAVQIRRQPGSSFKPFVYASALEQGMTPNSKIECGPYSYQMPDGSVWSPKGNGGCIEGDMVTLTEGLARSINTVAARLITQKTDPDKVIALARRLGIKSRYLKPVPSLALGVGEVSPIEMTSAFGVFSNDGIYVEPYLITKIEDKFGNIIYERKASARIKDAISTPIAHKITAMMQKVVDIGTAHRVREFFQNCEAAGKTGTTNDYADAWFVGYTPQLAAGVWVGFDDRRITFTGGYGYAGQVAVPLWAKFMASIYNDKRLPYKQRKFSLGFKDSLIIADGTEADSGHVFEDVPDDIIIKETPKDTLKKENDEQRPKLPKQQQELDALNEKTVILRKE
jgi:penicillin-binding protein 1A